MRKLTSQFFELFKNFSKFRFFPLSRDFFSSCLYSFATRASLSSVVSQEATRYREEKARSSSFSSVSTRLIARSRTTAYRITRGWSSLASRERASLYSLPRCPRLLIRALIEFTMVNERTKRERRATGEKEMEPRLLRGFSA